MYVYHCYYVGYIFIGNGFEIIILRGGYMKTLKMILLCFVFVIMFFVSPLVWIICEILDEFDRRRTRKSGGIK